jgi:hypothetical protein
MIIKKSNFNLKGKRYRGNWPFTVDQVAVVKFQIDKYEPFAILHEYRLYALSGMLESHGLPVLTASGIWDGKKSLQAFFDFIVEQSKGVTYKEDYNS